MRFAHADMLWLLALMPLVALFAWWGLAARRGAVRRFAGPVMASRLTESVSRARQNGKYALVVAALLLGLLALSGPQFGARLEMAERRGVDVVVCLDVSRSMLAQDIRPSRLDRARHLVDEVLDRLEGDRAALVLFAGKAFIQCPLTVDYGALRMLLAAADAGSIPSQGTDLAGAVSKARSCFEEGDRQFKAIVLLSDGEDHAGEAVGEAEAAGAEGVRLYAVGMGTPEGELIPVPGRGGVDYHKDTRGQYVKTRLAEKALRDMALAANGAYYRSTVSGREIDAVASAIANMEQKDVGAERLTRYEERYQIPLGLAIVCLLAEFLLSDRVQRRREWRGRFA